MSNGESPGPIWQNSRAHQLVMGIFSLVISYATLRNGSPIGLLGMAGMWAVVVGMVYYDRPAIEVRPDGR